MKNTFKKSGGVIIIRVNDNLVSSNDSINLTTQVDNYIANGSKKFVLDLNGVLRIDSAGYGVLINCKNLVEEKGGTIIYTNISKDIEKILDVCQAENVFIISNNTEEALAQFNNKEK